jgi:hypothetical protein
MPDVEQFDLLPFLRDAAYHAVDVRLMAVEQMPEICILVCHGAPVRMSFQAEDGLLETPVPFQAASDCRALISS